MNDKLLRLTQILQLIPIGKSTLWDKVKKGKFPKQIKLGKKIAVWKESDVLAYIERHCNSESKNEARHD